jgi:hypothetical protein
VSGLIKSVLKEINKTMNKYKVNSFKKIEINFIIAECRREKGQIEKWGMALLKVKNLLEEYKNMEMSQWKPFERYFLMRMDSFIKNRKDISFQLQLLENQYNF